jgi:tetratricopeptide (TPR) repeat protein
MKGSARLGSYLRQLRNGYGYSLRRVEERAKAEGGEIDNSQLSRYEKGICYPSFDKLRILASVFNVSIQSFSDVVDLEAFEDLKPDSGTPEKIVEDGLAAMGVGDAGLAFALFEGALELLQDPSDGRANALMIAQTRVNLSAALTRLGKLSLAEQELRTALKSAEHLDRKTKARALLALAHVHAEQGDLMLAELESDRAYGLAREEGLDLLAARALHAMGFALAQGGQDARAVEKYRQAAHLYEELEDAREAYRVRINIGTCYVSLGKHREGVRLLRAALDACRKQGHPRLEALAWTNLGEAYYRLQDHDRARQCFRRSESIVRAGEEAHADLLFVNAYYDWEMAREKDNPTRAKIAFGRLKALRSSIEKRFPEVRAFDAYVERGRRHA